jgi:hypothetical protein
VPQDAVLTLSFSTSDRQWNRLAAFQPPSQPSAWQQEGAQWRETLLADLGVSYEQDVRPWLGQEVTIAFLQEVQSASLSVEGEDPIALPDQVDLQWVLLLPIADPELAQATLNRLRSEAMGTVETYRGLPVVTRSGEGEPYTVSVLDTNAIAISPDPATINQVIDTYRGESAVSETPGYRTSFSEIAVGEPFVRIYVNAPLAKEMAIASAITPTPFWGITPLQQNQGMAATVVLTNEGLQVRGINWLPTDSDVSYDPVVASNQFSIQLPDDLWLMLSGGSLQAFWEGYRQRMMAEPDELANPNVLEQGIRTTTGLDLEQDLLSWMNGEFALAVLPPPASDTAEEQGGPGLVFMVQASNRRAADTALETLETALRDRYNMEISTDTLNGQEVTRWQSRFGSVQVTRAWLDNNVLALVLGEAIAEQLLPNPESNLASNALFRQVTSSSLNPNNGQVFINVEQFFEAANSMPFNPLPPPVETISTHIRAIGLTSAIESDRSTRYDINIILTEPEETSPEANPNADSDLLLPEESSP